MALLGKYVIENITPRKRTPDEMGIDLKGVHNLIKKYKVENEKRLYYYYYDTLKRYHYIKKRLKLVIF